MAKLYHRNYRRPMLRNIGRSTDASNIPFIGEASYDLATSGERVTQVQYSRVHRAKPVFPRAATGTPRVFTGYSRDQRSDTPLGLLSDCFPVFCAVPVCFSIESVANVN